jgi:hypothetical protein
MSNLVSIKIKIDTETMVNFFRSDPSLGTRNKPYKADNFCNVSATGAKSSGIRNVFKLEADTEYQFQLIDESTDPEITIVFDTATFGLSIMQLDTPTTEDWEKIMDLAYGKPRIDVTGDLIYNNKSDEQYLFEMKTQSEDQFKQYHNLQYSIVFQVNVQETVSVQDVIVRNKIMIARIDPLIANTSDEKR